MMGLPSGTRVWLIAGHTDMRKGFDGLAGVVQYLFDKDPFSGQLFVFRGRRGDRIKVLWWDGQGLCLFYKRLEQGRFVWPQAKNGVIHLSLNINLNDSQGTEGIYGAIRILFLTYCIKRTYEPWVHFELLYFRVC